MAGAAGHMASSKQGGGRGGGSGIMRGAPPGLERQGGAESGNQKASGGRQRNGNGKNGSSRPAQSQGARAQAEAHPDSSSGSPKTDAMSERLRFVSTVLVGYRVEVQVKSGMVYEGVLHTISVDPKDFHVVLLMAETVKNPGKGSGSDLVQRPVRKLIVHSKDLVQIVGKDVKMSAQDVGPLSEEVDAGGFGTDSSISRGKATGFGRELQPWVPDATAEDPNVSDGGDSSGKNIVTTDFRQDTAKSWDQFAAFERMTGSKTTFTEEQYTTSLNKSDPRMKALEAQAARIAKEIEGQTTSNFHQAEERGHAYDDSGITEEDKYSGVARGPQPVASAPKTAAKLSSPPASASASTATTTTSSKPPSESKLKGLNPDAPSFVPGGRKPAAAASSFGVSAAQAAAAAAAAAAQGAVSGAGAGPYGGMMQQQQMAGAGMYNHPQAMMQVPQMYQMYQQQAYYMNPNFPKSN